MAGFGALPGRRRQRPWHARRGFLRPACGRRRLMVPSGLTESRLSGTRVRSRLRRSLLCKPLSSGNVLPGALPGHVSGTVGFRVALFGGRA
jgi:hypothetical protein